MANQNQGGQSQSDRSDNQSRSGNQSGGQSGGQGFAGMSADNWYAIVVPAGTPQPIVAKLHAAALAATKAPEVKEKLAKIGSETLPMASPADFPAFLQRELDRWGAIVKAAKLEKK